MKGGGEGLLIVAGPAKGKGEGPMPSRGMGGDPDAKMQGMKREAFAEMVAAIRDGDDDAAFEAYNELCEY